MRNDSWDAILKGSDTQIMLFLLWHFCSWHYVAHKCIH